MRNKSSQGSLSKPFKSPRRVTGAQALASPRTPVRTKSSLGKELRTPESAPLHRALKANTQATLTPTRRIKRICTVSSTRSSRQHIAGTAPLTPLRDEETQVLYKEKTQLQRELKDIQEEVALLERAHALVEKDDASTVNGLISKWQIACSSACDDLFAIMKPAMESQRLSEKQGMYGSSEAAHANQTPGSDQEEEEEEIDTAFMLKRLGIDPALF